MIKEKLLDNFSLKLIRILNRERELGNEVVESSNSWPNEKTIIVVLKKPFLEE